MKKIDLYSNSERPSVITVNTLNILVGAFAVLFPLVLIAGSMLFTGCREIVSDISSYYYSGMRDVFTGILCAIALFLFSYMGYGLLDIISSKIAAITLLGVVYFPTDIRVKFYPCLTELPAYIKAFDYVHMVCAALFFITLSLMSFFLFTKSKYKKGDINFTKEKKMRNIIYRVCGIIIFVCTILVGIFSLFLKSLVLSKATPVFWLESAALWAFGFSWLVKGGFILRDSRK